MSYSVYRLTCATCGMKYAQLLPDYQEEETLLCPACEGRLERGGKLTGKDLLASGFSMGGG